MQQEKQLLMSVNLPEKMLGMLSVPLDQHGAGGAPEVDLIEAKFCIELQRCWRAEKNN
jgi:hypothetical protein